MMLIVKSYLRKIVRKAATGLIIPLLLVIAACGDNEGSIGTCTVNCGRLGYKIDIRYYNRISEEECKEKAKVAGCTARYCPPGIESQEECYDINEN